MKCERMKGEVEPETKKFRVFRDFICDAVDEEDAFQQFGEWEEHHDLEESKLWYTGRLVSQYFTVRFLVEEYHKEESK